MIRMRTSLLAALLGLLLSACGPEPDNVNPVELEMKAVTPVDPGDSCFLDSGTMTFDLGKGHSFQFNSASEASSGGLGPNWYSGRVEIVTSYAGKRVVLRTVGAHGPPDTLPEPPAFYRFGADSPTTTSKHVVAGQLYPPNDKAQHGLFVTKDGRKVLVQGLHNELRIYMEPYGLIYTYVNRSRFMTGDIMERRLRGWDGDTVDPQALFGPVKGLIRKYQQERPQNRIWYY